MDIQYKPSKPKKEKTAKVPKAPKAEKAVKFSSSVQAVKSSKPAKPPKAPKAQKAPKPEKVKEISFGKPDKVEKTAKGGINRQLKPGTIIAILAIVLTVVIGSVTFIILTGAGDNGYDTGIANLTITSLPKKVKYYVGERMMYTGMEITVSLKNGETYSLRPEDCTISGFDNTKSGSCTVTVTYQNVSSSFSVAIIERPAAQKILTGIQIVTLPKTLYKKGDYLDTVGGVILREYKDGSTSKTSLINNFVYGFDKIDGPGEYTLTVKYSENGLSAETTYTITVTE